MRDLHPEVDWRCVKGRVVVSDCNVVGNGDNYVGREVGKCISAVEA